MSALTRTISHPRASEFRKPVDVACVLARVLPVLFSVVLDADLELLPPHVDAPPVARTICVCGRGSPASTRTSRVRVSCGDSAPPSIRSTTVAQLAQPRTPG